MHKLNRPLLLTLVATALSASCSSLIAGTSSARNLARNTTDLGSSSSEGLSSKNSVNLAPNAAVATSDLSPMEFASSPATQSPYDKFDTGEPVTTFSSSDDIFALVHLENDINTVLDGKQAFTIATFAKKGEKNQQVAATVFYPDLDKVGGEKNLPLAFIKTKSDKPHNNAETAVDFMSALARAPEGNYEITAQLITGPSLFKGKLISQGSFTIQIDKSTKEYPKAMQKIVNRDLAANRLPKAGMKDKQVAKAMSNSVRKAFEGRGIEVSGVHDAIILNEDWIIVHDEVTGKILHRSADGAVAYRLKETGICTVATFTFDQEYIGNKFSKNARVFDNAAQPEESYYIPCAKVKL